MNTNVTCVDVDENELRSPSPNKKSKKQLTLFEMKGKFCENLNRSLNQSISSLSPSPTKGKRSVLSKSNKANIQEKVEKSEDDEDCVDLTVAKSLASEKTKKILTNSKNSPPNNENRKKTNVDKTSSNKKKSGSNANIMEFFGKKTPVSNNKEIDKDVEEILNTKEDAEQPTATEAEPKFSNIVEKMNIAETTRAFAAALKTPCSVELIKINLKEKIKKIGDFAFENREKAMKTGDDESENKKLQNWMFGDIAVIIEIYNTIVPYYKAKNVGKKQSRNFPEKKDKKNPAKMTDVELTSIEYENFVNCLSGFNDDPNEELFLQIVRNLLFIFIRLEDVFSNKTLFGIDMKSLDLESCFLQELCRMVLIGLFVNNSTLKATTNDTVFIKPPQLILENCPIIKELEKNHSDISFGDICLASKILLVRVLCESLLFCSKYEDLKEKLEKTIDTTKNLISNHEAHLMKLLNIPEIEFSKNRKRYFKDAKASTSNAVLKLMDKLDKAQEKIKDQKLSKRNLDRLLPLGIDCDENVYWNLSFFRGIVIEIRTQDEQRSQWFLFDTKKKIQGLIDCLKLSLKCGDLVTNLKSFSESLFKDDSDTAANYSENAPVTEENDVSKAKSDDEDDDSKVVVESRYSLRRSARKAEEALKEILNDSNNVEKESNSDDDDKKEAARRVKHGQDDEAYFDYFIGWIESNDSWYSIDNFLLYLTNLARMMSFYGFAQMSKFDSLKETVKGYSGETTFAGKFYIIRDVLAKIYDLVSFKMSNFKNLFLLSSPKLMCGVECKNMIDYLKDYINSTESLSSLYFLLYLFMNHVKWTNFKEHKKCGVCNLKGNKLKFIESIDNFESEEYNKTGYFTCIKCYTPYHKQCTLDDEQQLTESGNLICNECRKQKENFVYEVYDENEVASNKKEPMNEDELYAERKLRVTKTVNYKENINPKEFLTKYSENSRSSEGSRISRSSSNSSVESLSKFNYKPKNRYQTRLSRTSTRKSIDEEEQSQRSSNRLRDKRKLKTVYVDDDSDGDDEK